MGIRMNRYLKPDHHRNLLYPMNVGGVHYFGKTRLAGGELPILSLFLSEIITKISSLLIDLLL